MVNTILARRVNHIVAKGDNPAWPKGSKSRGFSNSYVNDVSVLGGISQLSTLGNKINISQGKRLFIIHIYVKESLSQTA